MKPLRSGGQALATSLTALGVALAVWTPAPPASADPADTSQQNAGDGDAATTACKTFSVAENYAASGYEDFANASAGGGNYVNYTDPQVTDTNVAGRTALREAAAGAMQASTTPGLAPDISRAMQTWSLRVMKLLAVMGLHGGGNTLNSSAADVNEQSQLVERACAPVGAPR